jgi:hypothetical protein
LWRPFPDEGCYGTVGEDIYTETDLGLDGLVDRTLEPENYLAVQPGDVVGYFMSREGRTGMIDGIQPEPHGEGDGEGSGSTPLTTVTTSCPTSVGGGGKSLMEFTNSAPVLSVDVGKVETMLPHYTQSLFPMSVHAVAFPCPDGVTSAPSPSPPQTEDGTTESQPSTSNVETTTAKFIIANSWAIAGAGMLLLATMIVLGSAVARARKKTVVFGNTPSHRTEQDAYEMSNAYTNMATDEHYVMMEEKRDKKQSEKVAFVPKNISVDTNQCYRTATTSVDPDYLYAALEVRHQQQEIEISQNEAYAATNIPVETNQCYGTTTPLMDPDHLYAALEVRHQQQEIEISQNEAYAATNIPVETNQCYGTTTLLVDPDHLYAALEVRHQQQEIEISQNEAYAATNIPVETNLCYGITTPLVDSEYAALEVRHQQQEIEISQNEAYAATNIPVETNQCYGITTPSVDPNLKPTCKAASTDCDEQYVDVGVTQKQAYTTANDAVVPPALETPKEEYDYINPSFLHT